MRLLVNMSSEGGAKAYNSNNIFLDMDNLNEKPNIYLLLPGKDLYACVLGFMHLER